MTTLAKKQKKARKSRLVSKFAKKDKGHPLNKDEKYKTIFIPKLPTIKRSKRKLEGSIESAHSSNTSLLKGREIHQSSQPIIGEKDNSMTAHVRAHLPAESFRVQHKDHLR
mmetsp:Transcript_36248/g.55679  ORF Transcript_36248/g.55679 Transcript_36248/m.55679 type:complete len:111 (+) Transcript_36248:1037-1369(+)